MKPTPQAIRAAEEIGDMIDMDPTGPSNAQIAEIIDREMNGWRPISDAPKDRDLSLWSGGACSVGKYNDDRYSKTPRPFWQTEKGYLFGKTWIRTNQPTHFREIPAPPAP